VVAPSLRVGGGSSAGAATAVALDKQVVPLFSAEEAKDFRGQWDAIQVNFVDEPRRLVEQADGLVAVATKRLAEMFAAERARLEGQWDRGTTSRRKISVWQCSAVGRSSAAFSRCEEAGLDSLAVPRC
jgi:hypothetical protein